MFMTHKRALEIAEREHEAEMSYGECLAEAGMGAVSFGWSGYDGMSEYRAIAAERERQWEEDNPEKAARYYEEVSTAKQIVSTFDNLVLYAEDDMAILHYLPRIPEYRLDFRKDRVNTSDVPF